jgi:hypothetical protein
MNLICDDVISEIHKGRNCSDRPELDFSDLLPLFREGSKKCSLR